jgi:hypothetical protein
MAGTTRLALVAAVGLAAAGCADGGTGVLSTASLGSATANPAVTMAAKNDPACVALTARIDAIRKDGVVDRAEKAATGKATTVSVKRESLAKLAELDKANAEFQSKCARPLTTASVSPSPAAAAAPPAAKPAAPSPAAKP